MPLTSTITAYDAEWPRKYNEELERLRPIFGDALRAIHHVGSTAVPGLSAKPEIDILVVVSDLKMADEWTIGLTRLGYRRGGDLSAGHQFYKRDIDGVRTHKIHVCREPHPQIEKMLKFRDHLRSHSDLRERYQALKLKLEEENTRGIGEYLEGKAPFVEEVLSAIEASERGERVSDTRTQGSS